MGKTSEHPEQDPAEGSREAIERELKRQDEKQADRNESDARDTPDMSSPGAEAAEPSPES